MEEFKVLTNMFSMVTHGMEIVPQVTINGKKLSIIDLTYRFHTASDVSSGVNYLEASGFLEGDMDSMNFPFLKVFRINYKTGTVKIIFEEECRH